MPRKGHNEEQTVFVLWQVENGSKEPRVCRKLGLGLLYKHRREPRISLRLHLKELAASLARFGYRRLTVRLRRDGWTMNTKRACWTYKVKGLIIRPQLRNKIARRRPIFVESANAPHQRWSMDSVAARL